MIAQVLVDVIAGSADTLVRVRAVDSAFDLASPLTLTAGGAIASIFLYDSDFVEFFDFTFDCDDTGVTCLTTVDPSLSHWHDCIFENATSHNIVNDAGGGVDSFVLFNPIIRNGGANGLHTGSTGDNNAEIYGGQCYGHTSGYGIGLSATGNFIDGMLIHGNLDGILIPASDAGRIVNCTINGNIDAGIEWDGISNGADRWKVESCIISNNGVDFKPTGSTYFHWIVQNCCLFNNTATYTPIIGTLDQYNIITTNPTFTSTTPGASGFLVPGSGWSGVDNPEEGQTIGALCATAGGGAGGGVQPLTGLLN
jgi:hypothetical protein